jgi:hypothetical protein
MNTLLTVYWFLKAERISFSFSVSFTKKLWGRYTFIIKIDRALQRVRLTKGIGLRLVLSCSVK